MINNNYNRLVNSFSILKIRSYDRMQLNNIHDLACLPVPPEVIYDIWCILIFYDHYHEQSISYKIHPNRLNNYLYACWVILHAYSLSAVSFIFPFI